MGIEDVERWSGMISLYVICFSMRTGKDTGER